MNKTQTVIRFLYEQLKSLLKESLSTTLFLLKITIPINLVVKLLMDFELIQYVGVILSPLMRLMGLPGEAGIGWAVAIFTQPFVGFLSFLPVLPAYPYTVAQVTVLMTAMMVAHALPVELRIAQQVGGRLWFLFLLRMGGAIVLCAVLNQIYTLGNFLQQPYTAPFFSVPNNNSWAAWLRSQFDSALTIFLFIIALLLLMRTLNALRLTERLTGLLKPALVFLGMSEAVAPLALIGALAGLSLGGGLIINEAQKGKLTKRDVFFSLSMISIFHSAIDDTVIGLAVGSHVSGVLWGRLILSLVMTFLLVKLFYGMPDSWFDRYLIHAENIKKRDCQDCKGAA